MAATHPSSVLTEQTTTQFSPQPSYGDVLRDSCRPAYAAAIRAYSCIDGTSEHARPKRLRECRRLAWFSRHIDTGEVRVASSSCSLRWCPICQNSRRNYVTVSIAEWLTESDHPKFLTLTLKHTHAPLDHQIHHLYNYFKLLRRRREFIHAVSGGIWFFQVKKSKTDGLWHPHLHAVITGKYFAQRRLSRIWSEITCGSTHVDIRPIFDPKGAANDVARYATSPGTLVGLPPDDAVELVEALHGRRICGTWGSARGVSLRPKPAKDKDKWKNLGNWNTVFGMYDTSADARAIVNSWKNRQPLPEGISVLEIDIALNNMSDPSWGDYDFESVYDHKGSDP